MQKLMMFFFATLMIALPSYGNEPQNQNEKKAPAEVSCSGSSEESVAVSSETCQEQANTEE